jgi:hypothetical protein
MPLSWNDIKARAAGFERRWRDASDERSQAQEFWVDFFDIFGVRKPRVASFEHAVKKHGGGKGFIDLFWPGVLLIEHKSRGKDLARAHDQAMAYFPGLKERDLPRYVLVSDFARFRLFDLEEGSDVEFTLAELPKHIKRFAFVAGYRTQTIRPQDEVNVKAAQKLGVLHDALKVSGYDGHPLELLLVRLLFCLFADDTGIFQPAQSWRAWLEERTAVDGSDLGPQLAALFQVLNTPDERRSAKLDEQLRAFPYVNGRLFEEMLPLASFDAAMREQLLDASALDWSVISPAIFGAMFQSISDDKARRALGAHYTSEENILKLIKPLFLDELRAEFERVKRQRNRLFEFHKKLRSLVFLDPACGCGNFLVITYRELRLLELDVLRAAYADGQQTLDVHTLVNIDVDQFHGIEIEEFPAQIAQVALWLVDHQMNVRVGDEFGAYFARIPLKATPHIVHGNALRLDWDDVLPAERCSYVLGNPPFIGHQNRSPEQAADMTAIWGSDGRFGRLDYVTAWYACAARYLQGQERIRCAFVSTNSICQGEQVGTLWAWLLERGIRIDFAHRTFKWSNEASGKAAVHCVIVGFGMGDRPGKRLFEYAEVDGEPHEVAATNINPYLVDGPNVVLPSRAPKPPGLPLMTKGSQPTDGGHLLLDQRERDELLAVEPAAKPWLRRYLGAEELLHATPRWCLWLKGIDPRTLRGLPSVLQRVQAVREVRLVSPTAAVREAAESPTLFTQDRQPETTYLAVPAHTSELRRFIPIAFLGPETVASNALRICPGATLFHFGVVMSTMHNAWVRYTCGRIKSDLRYEPNVYNTFPWPEVDEAQRKAIEAAAQGVLDARAAYPGNSLADLYDDLAMPLPLRKAHQKLDAAADAAYPRPGKKGFDTDAERVVHLFERYRALTSLLPAEAPARKASGRKPRATPSAT